MLLATEGSEQEVSTARHKTLRMRHDSAGTPLAVQRLPGTVGVVKGQSIVSTSVDLTSRLNRGDVVLIAGESFTVPPTDGTFDATQFPIDTP